MRTTATGTSDLFGCTWLRSEHLRPLIVGQRLEIEIDPHGVYWISGPLDRVAPPARGVAQAIEKGMEALIRSAAKHSFPVKN